MIKRINKSKGRDIEVFSEKIKGRKVYFVSKITNKKIATGQARSKQHALRWANRIA